MIPENKTTGFEKIFADVRRRRKKRIRDAGKHECVKVSAGVVRRVTGRDNVVLKRPVIVLRMYACKICGRGMTPNK